jgi:hypothetical protein
MEAIQCGCLLWSSRGVFELGLWNFDDNFDDLHILGMDTGCLPERLRGDVFLGSSRYRFTSDWRCGE